jgi:NADPH-dependent glutamate synthase beta subunit-like oxidoreductase
MKTPAKPAEVLTEQQAVAEASRCLFCYDAPCGKACPADVDVAGFIRRIRSGNFSGAHRLIWEQNVLGGVCGRVCPVEQLCEEACSHTELSRAIEIGALQAFACEQPFSPAGNGEKPRGPKVAVIGGGPSGLAAAAELALRGYRPTVFEKMKEDGGQARWSILEPKLPREVVAREIQRVRDLGVKFRHNVRTLKSISPSRLKREGFKAVFLGVGLPGGSCLNVAGMDLDGIEAGRDLLHRIAAARTAGERRAIKVGKNTIVIGGGNVAVDTARALKSQGARKVVVVSLEGPTEMPAYPSEIQAAWAGGVEFMTRARVTSLEGDRRGRVRQVRGVGIEWKVPGEYVPSNAVDLEGTEFLLLADRVYMAIGQCSDPVVAETFCVATDRRGMIKVKKKTGQTSVPWIFAGGDGVSGGGTVVEAVADGKRAARGIDAFLGSKGKGGRGRG